MQTFLKVMAGSQGATMFVGVIHQIADPERFRATEAVALKKRLPPDVALAVEFMTPDDKTGISIWEGPSVDAVRQVVEYVVGGCSDTEYIQLEVRGLWDRYPGRAKLVRHKPAQDGPRHEGRVKTEPQKARGFSGPSGFALMPGWSQRTAV